MEHEITEIKATDFQWICPCCGYYNHLGYYPKDLDKPIGCCGCDEKFIMDNPIILT